jgi:hypothetical protein
VLFRSHGLPGLRTTRLQEYRPGQVKPLPAKASFRP